MITKVWHQTRVDLVILVQESCSSEAWMVKCFFGVVNLLFCDWGWPWGRSGFTHQRSDSTTWSQFSIGIGHSSTDCTNEVLISRQQVYRVKTSETLESNPTCKLWEKHILKQGWLETRLPLWWLSFSSGLLEYWCKKKKQKKKRAGPATGNCSVIHSCLALPWPGLHSWVSLWTSDTVWWEPEPCRHLYCVPDSLGSPSEASLWLRRKSRWGFCRRHTCQTNWSSGGWSSKSNNAHCVLLGI